MTKTFTLEVTHHHKIREEDIHVHQNIEAIEANYLVIDGERLDLRGHSGSVRRQKGDGWGGHTITVDENGNSHLAVRNIYAVGATLPDDFIEIFTEFPAYMKGMAKSPQQAFKYHDSDYPVTKATEDHIARWTKILKEASNNWTRNNNSADWAHKWGMEDSWGEPNAEAKKRYQNLNGQGRLLGIGFRVVKKYEAATYTDKGVPSGLDTVAKIDDFISKITHEFRADRDWYYWFAKHSAGGRQTDRRSLKVGTTRDNGVFSEILYSAADAEDYADLLSELQILRKSN